MSVQSLPILDRAASASPPARAVEPVVSRPQVQGKFLSVDGERFWIKGVTYGTFEDAGDDPCFPARAVVAADFRDMAQAGLNAVRVYTVPPVWLLDEAARNGLRVMVGLPWEQHVDFLADPGSARAIQARLQSAVSACAGHPAILCYAVGNEIPATVVRWLGARRVTRFLRQLAGLVRRCDPGALVTYVNFPTTEYLDLSFADFLSFNVYLEDRPTLARYLARLQNLAGERPLVMAEIGLDSRRNGEAAQGETLAWQIEACFEAAACGVFMFAWTDEWHRGGHEILDWDFGLVRRDRTPKPALRAVTKAFAAAPLSDRDWPTISVVVCSYNGAATIEETLRALVSLDYPNKQIIVVNDGSTDATAAIAARYDVQLISTENRGLSNARNTGLDAARGEIVAYIDDDAYPDPQWLKFLAVSFMQQDVGAVGGPNIAPPDDGDIAECVANAPGGPIHVLVGDQIAEHIPGCNMAFRAEKLRAIGGFDPQFRVAGDDVDACWRLMETGEVIGFHAGALVWHHRRPSVARYLKQQRGYARAEALLANKWPEKYNWAGHLSWHGRLYGRGLVEAPLTRWRIYHGTWNSAPFQSIYAQAPGLLTSLPLMPEWYAMVAAVGMLALIGLAWSPLLILLPVALAGAGLSLGMAIHGGLRAHFATGLEPRTAPWKMRAVVAWLHLVQPAARLIGRIQNGVGPWRRRDLRVTPAPLPAEDRVWSDTWTPIEARLTALLEHLRASGVGCRVGADMDAFDLDLTQSLFSEIRVTSMVEEHGGGRQLVRFRTRPALSPLAWLLVGGVGVLSLIAALDGAKLGAALLGVLASGLALQAYVGLCRAKHGWRQALVSCFGPDLVK